MKSIYSAVWAEGLKIRKTKIFWLTICFFAFIPMMMSLLLIVQRYPDLATKLGMIGTKASMMRFGEANWSNYLVLLGQGIAAIGLIGYGFITSWVFGFEYADRTIKDLLALPTHRHTLVSAKFIAVLVWGIILTLVYIAVAFACGLIIHIPGWSHSVIISNLTMLFSVAIMSILLSTPVAFFACFSKGYFLPLGFVILTLIMANFTGIVGLGPYFPWAIPGIYSTQNGTEAIHLVSASYYILTITSLLGLGGTLTWFRYADQK